MGYGAPASSSSRKLDCAGVVCGARSGAVKGYSHAAVVVAGQLSAAVVIAKTAGRQAEINSRRRCERCGAEYVIQESCFLRNH